MSISDTNTTSTAASIIKRKRLQKGYKVTFIVSVLCLLFGQIYLHFSYGMDSFYMRNLFVVPLILGVIPMFLLSLRGYRFINRITFNLWNSGIAVITFGFLVEGIVGLSGRFTDYTTYYWYIGTFFCLISLISILVGLLNRKEI